MQLKQRLTQGFLTLAPQWKLLQDLSLHRPWNQFGSKEFGALFLETNRCLMLTNLLEKI